MRVTLRRMRALRSRRINFLFVGLQSSQTIDKLLLRGKQTQNMGYTSNAGGKRAPASLRPAGIGQAPGPWLSTGRPAGRCGSGANGLRSLIARTPSLGIFFRLSPVQNREFFLGEFPRSLDDRFRLSIPQELLDPFLAGGSETILAKERPGALSLWNAASLARPAGGRRRTDQSQNGVGQARRPAGRGAIALAVALDPPSAGHPGRARAIAHSRGFSGVSRRRALVRSDRPGSRRLSGDLESASSGSVISKGACPNSNNCSTSCRVDPRGTVRHRTTQVRPWPDESPATNLSGQAT